MLDSQHLNRLQEAFRQTRIVHQLMRKMVEMASRIIHVFGLMEVVYLVMCLKCL